MDDTSPGEITLTLPQVPSTLTSIRARLGDAPSQTALGLACTRAGQYEEALEWLDQAAPKMPIASVLYYNAMLFGGAQTSQYLQRAVDHLQAAAKADCWEAQQVLASLYVHGKGVPKDLNEASRLIERSRKVRDANDA